MAHSYRSLHHWNHWLSQEHLGINLLSAEEQYIKQLLKNHFGKHAMLIGVPHQASLLKATPLPFYSLLSPLTLHAKKMNSIESDLSELPLHSGTIDILLMPHTMEFIDNPRQLLSEACRVIKPEGVIVICGFNPWSTWGLKKWLTKPKHAPWTGTFIQASQIKRWLKLADFELEDQKSILYRPPLSHRTTYQKINFIEKIGSKCFPMLGGVYILIARAKVIPLTPIRWKWKQQLSGIRISSTVTGHIARSTK